MSFKTLKAINLSNCKSHFATYNLEVCCQKLKQTTKQKQNKNSAVLKVWKNNNSKLPERLLSPGLPHELSHHWKP